MFSTRFKKFHNCGPRRKNLSRVPTRYCSLAKDSVNLQRMPLRWWRTTRSWACLTGFTLTIQVPSDVWWSPGMKIASKKKLLRTKNFNAFMRICYRSERFAKSRLKIEHNYCKVRKTKNRKEKRTSKKSFCCSTWAWRRKLGSSSRR